MSSDPAHDPLPTLSYATPTNPAKKSRRSGIMGIFLGLAWLPSELVYSPTVGGRFLSVVLFLGTVSVILILHREFTRGRRVD